MGPPSYMRFVVDRNVVMRRITVLNFILSDPKIRPQIAALLYVGACCRCSSHVWLLAALPLHKTRYESYCSAWCLYLYLYPQLRHKFLSVRILSCNIGNRYRCCQIYLAHEGRTFFRIVGDPPGTWLWMTDNCNLQISQNAFVFFVLCVVSVQSDWALCLQCLLKQSSDTKWAVRAECAPLVCTRHRQCQPLCTAYTGCPHLN